VRLAAPKLGFELATMELKELISHCENQFSTNKVNTAYLFKTLFEIQE
jgi:hypothetical protein